ncbi:MAG: hypothetical protein LBM41_04240 [Ruminococcus sp.]|jgi:hypothetical protein|nr:hypothetical protein [Ruminococcus sp.]
MNRKLERKYFYVLIVLVTVLVFLSLSIIFLPRPERSETENRPLAPFPKFTTESYLNGSFTRDLTLWFADTVPFRDNILKLSSRLKEFEGIRQDNIKFHGNVQIVATEPEQGETAPQNGTEPPSVADLTPEYGRNEPGGEGDPLGSVTAATEPAETEPETDSLEFDNNGIVTIGDRSFMLFGGNRVQGKYYADVLNAYKVQLGEGINVYSMVVPTAVEFYLPDQYAEYSNSELNQINYIYENLVGVTPIDAYSVLASHTDEDIYLKTDHHWAQLGAYYASIAFAETLGEPVQPISDYEKKSREGYVGSLYGYTNDIKILESPERFDYYIQPLPYKTEFFKYDTLASEGYGSLIYETSTSEKGYQMFIGSDAKHIKVTTENKNGKRLCVFKESFGNALIPSLIPYFEEIYVIDIRFFGMNAIDYMKQEGITDVLFVNNIFAANTQMLIDYINNLRYGPVGLTTAATEETETETTLEQPEPPLELLEETFETTAPPIEEIY